MKKKKNIQELKRLYWKTDKEQILHILSRVNIKYLRSLVNQCKNIQNDSEYLNGRDALLVMVSPELRNEFIENHNKSYTDTKVWCKYDGCIFHVSLKTLKDEMHRREKNNEVLLDYVYSSSLKKHYYTPIILLGI